MRRTNIRKRIAHTCGALDFVYRRMQCKGEETGRTHQGGNTVTNFFHSLSFPVVLLLLATIATASAQTRGYPPFSSRVNVEISAEESIQNEITSLISRELRKLGDVVMVNEDYTYKLSIVVIEHRLESGRTVGVSFSVVILQTVPSDLLLKPLVKADSWKSVESWVSKVYFYVGHFIQTGPKNELEDLCRSVVAKFDSNHLEKDRKEYQRIIDNLNKKSKN